MIFDRNEKKEVIALLGAGSMGTAIVRRIAAVPPTRSRPWRFLKVIPTKPTCAVPKPTASGPFCVFLRVTV